MEWNMLHAYMHGSVLLHRTSCCVIIIIIIIIIIVLFKLINN